VQRVLVYGSGEEYVIVFDVVELSTIPETTHYRLLGEIDLDECGAFRFRCVLESPVPEFDELLVHEALQEFAERVLQ